MNICLRKALPVYAFILTIAVLMLVPSLSFNAHAQCAVSICKVAPQLPVPQTLEEVVFFPFTVTQAGNSESGGIGANFQCEGLAFSGNDLEIVEDSFSGWELESVECSDSALVDVTFIENGVSLDCLGGTEITCTFTNVRSASPIPTLSEWGMIAAAVGLMLTGLFFAVRRKKVFNI